MEFTLREEIVDMLNAHVDGVEHGKEYTKRERLVAMGFGVLEVMDKHTSKFTTNEILSLTDWTREVKPMVTETLHIIPHRLYDCKVQNLFHPGASDDCKGCEDFSKWVTGTKPDEVYVGETPEEQICETCKNFQPTVTYLCYKRVYGTDGLLIGDVMFTEKIVHQLGIRPEGRDPDSIHCSIGKSHLDDMWYGWSHRAIMGFGIGHIVGGANLSEKFITGYIVTTEEECRELACIFAVSVS